ncbi:fimbrillin family protein [Prevotella communis]|uniref:fimbrillin family protein n=1 Tax=Prevotella communis TaxID=2913614 RepID=UPI001EDB4B56|nr:fimbrillin family protein [Prevotella communis]UKK62624.1 fimbrillin family protein [Prevotella communis]UKK65449.1 fimbrillin family protein [Prevotella communis]
MKRNYLYKLSQLVLMMTFILGMTGCNETIDSLFSDGISEGEEVMFTTSLPGAPATRGAHEDYEEEMNKYQAVNKAYEFTIDMYADGKVIGTGTYGPDTLKTDGTLSPKTGHTPLYWSSTTVPYAFKAVAGTEDLSPVQNTQKDWLQQDRLEGYGYVQLWDENNNTPTDNLDALNYHTAKEWKALNNQSKMVSDNNDLKKIPLYLQHKRSLISIILKAGEGVTRKALAYDVAENDLSAKIFSYDTAGSPIEIMPLAKEEKIHYDKDKNGGAEDSVSTTRYDAIVYPYDYSANPSTDLIARISLSGQHYSFYAQNDYLFDDPDNPSKASYRLEPGKRLVITVTLSRDSRKILMSAYVEDWTEEVTNTICDDYGNAGEPIKISNRTELITFLESDEKNKPGNVALVTNNIDLQDWPSTYDLCCTLNLGGKTIISNHRFLNSLQDAATLQNGTIQIGGVVDAAVAETNKGAIEDVRVTTKDAEAHATAAGVVVNNTGTISKCHSALRVSDGTVDYVGGIAATSLSAESKIAIIDGCTVTNRVDGGSKKGGGIVGMANGYINNNTFEYGITLNQDKTQFKNIVGERNNNHATLNVENNAWPTVDDNSFGENRPNTNAFENPYSGIIDCEDELEESTTSTIYNQDKKRYRLAKDITVQKNTGDVKYELDGNGKTITTKAMIFDEVTGIIHNLTVDVIANLEATQDATQATDGIAPLAFAVHGDGAEISNIKVKTLNNTVIKASNPAGVVVWAYDNAIVKNCEVLVNLYANVSTSVTQGRKFTGGIVSTSSKATVTQCIIHSGSKFDGTGASVIYCGGIVGGIENKSNSNNTSELTITDCTSFITLTQDEKHGAILGSANVGASTVIATSKTCQGNWWQDNCNGVGTPKDSDESLIGKRNAITPMEKDF